MKHALLLTGVLAAALLGGEAEAKPTAEKILFNMDADNDGRVSRKEWKNPPKAFNRFDDNGDGYLDYDELRAQFGGAARAKKNREPVQWIDVHVHPNSGRGAVRDPKGAIDAAVAVMEDSHMSHMVLMPQPMINVKKGDKIIKPTPIEAWIEEARKYPDRFVVMGGGGSLNSLIHDHAHDGQPSAELKKKFADRAEAILALGAVGFGELSVLHLSLIPGHSFEDIPADHPLLMMLSDITAKHGVVIDMHYDMVPEDMEKPRYLSDDNPPYLKANLAAFERFLENNRGAKISWAHTGSDQLGFRTAAFMDKMFEKHPNLYTSLRMNEGRSGRNYPMGDNGIKPEWMRLFKKFPDRFFLGGDQFFIPPAMAKGGGPAIKFSRFAKTMRNNFNVFLSHLPEDLARKIGSENAKRVYQIK